MVKEYKYMYNDFYLFNFQIMFFGMCDIIFSGQKGATQYIQGPNYLLIYYIITYFVKRIIDMVNNRSKTVREFVPHTTFKSLFICIIKIILEWAKAVIAILCLKEQGLKSNSSIVYILITSTYFLASEPTYAPMFPTIVKKFNYQPLEGLEDLYAPIILNTYCICITLILMPFSIYYQFTFVGISFYHNVYLKYYYMKLDLWEPFKEAKCLMSKFPVAEKLDLEKWNDICAICLNNMTHARRTPCGHIFHAQCLRCCIKISTKCPLCKADIVN